MSAALEAFVARLYSDAALRQDFIARPEAVALAAGLDAPTALRLAGTDFEGLALAADSFAHKRAAHAGRRPAPEALSRLRRWLRW
jgi:hypothetical protein